MLESAAPRRYHPSFWVANGTELFERLAFYGNQAVMAIYLHEHLKLTTNETSALMGLAGTVVGWLGALGESFPLFWLLGGILALSGAGAGFVKPVVTGTVARTTTKETRSTGFSIYYTLVNLGGAIGPLIAMLVRKHLGIQYVFEVGAATCLLMVLATLVLFREPEAALGEEPGKPLGQALLDLVRVLRNWRFVFFLVVFSVFWMMFFQFFIAMPLYIRSYVDPNADVDKVLSVGPACIVLFQVAVNHVWRKQPPTRVILIGFVIASFSMLLVGAYPSMWLVVAALVLFSIGEMTQAPRFYEYVSLLAPPGQTGLFMGYSFAPIALGSAMAGAVGGPLLKYFGEEIKRPELMWSVLFASGIAACILMLLFNRFAGNATQAQRTATAKAEGV
ncbi:MAG: MFS transporter [Polyangiaceae bacterium]|nr:MFS transporter [Polyangiaceae bacterium]